MMSEVATKESKDKAPLALVNEKSSEFDNGDTIKDVWLGNFF